MRRLPIIGGYAMGWCLHAVTSLTLSALTLLSLAAFSKRKALPRSSRNRTIDFHGVRANFVEGSSRTMVEVNAGDCVKWLFGLTEFPLFSAGGFN
jgi:hypothetical protein